VAALSEEFPCQVFIIQRYSKVIQNLRSLKNYPQVAFEEPNEDVTAEKPKEKRRFFRRHKRGSKRPEILTIETAIEELGELVGATEVQPENVAAEPESSNPSSIAAAPSIETDWTEPSWQDDELASKQQEVSTNTGSWNFKLEIEKPEEEKN
jgi:hypothetical protein